MAPVENAFRRSTIPQKQFIIFINPVFLSNETVKRLNKFTKIYKNLLTRDGNRYCHEYYCLAEVYFIDQTTIFSRETSLGKFQVHSINTS